uniref:Uncharacterized protein n=1 Tax=Lactuca sativa TaxID=4236 RepID=A0A9R1V963_LACSA|nr:hypothetical protein LSAT_V11C600322050 [Lactuca sativa]
MPFMFCYTNYFSFINWYNIAFFGDCWCYFNKHDMFHWFWAIIDIYDSPCVIVIDKDITFYECIGSYKTNAQWNFFLRDWDTLINSLTLTTYLRNYAKPESKLTYHPGSP